MLVVNFCHTADITTRQYPRADLQRIMMARLIGLSVEMTNQHQTIDYEFHHHEHPPYRNPEQARDECTWFGVSCVSGIVDGIRWTPFDHTPVSLRFVCTRWAPPTLKNIVINNQRVVINYKTFSMTFSARHLPRGLINFERKDCQLVGSVQVDALPQGLTRLIMPRNELYGVIDLRSLPSLFIEMDLSRNEIYMTIIDNDQLPETLKTVDLGMKVGSPGALVAVEVHGREIDDRIHVEPLLSKKSHCGIQ